MLEKKTNPHLQDTIVRLRQASREHEAPLWRAVAKQLEKPSRVWPVVNVGEIQLNAEEGAPIVVAGKVLGGGYLDRAVTVAAWAFSNSAREKIENAGGTCLRLPDALEQFPDASGVQVMA